MFKRPLGPAAVVVGLALSAAFVRVARADAAPTEAQITAARALFVEAEADEDARRWQDALEKLARVSAIKLTPGVRYHTALCEEHLGQLVAALRDYKAAATQAREENAADVLRLVDKRIAESSARIPQVVLVLVPSLPDAAARIDGQPVGAGVPIPVDPGTHHIEVVAPGYTSSARTITLDERASISLELKLDAASPPPAAAPVPSPAPARADATRERTSGSAPSRDRTVAIVAAAGALVLAGGGVGAYLAASHEQASSVQTCAQVASNDPNACAPQRNVIRTWDWIAVAAWTGAAGAGALAIVSLASHHHDAASAPPTHVLIGPASVALAGSF